jgi:hypothetical protein
MLSISKSLILKGSFLVLFGLITVCAQAGTVHVQNQNITPQKCFLKFFNKYTGYHNIDIAAVVKGIPPIGLDKASTFEIPNGVYEGIRLECEIIEPVSKLPDYPSTQNPKMQKAMHIDPCNKVDLVDPAHLKTITVKKDSHLAIAVDINKDTNSAHCAIINISEF